VLDADGAAGSAGYHLTALAFNRADARCRAHAPEPALRRGIACPASSARRTAHELPDPPGQRAVRGASSAHPGRHRGRARDRQVDLPGRLNGRGANQPGTSPFGAGVGARKASSLCVTERNLDWMAACHRDLQGRWRVPPHRAAFSVRSHREDAPPRRLPAGADERGSTATLDHAARLTVRSRRALHRRGLRGGPCRPAILRVEVAPDQLAYIYFTSGSPASPRGRVRAHGHAQTTSARRFRT